MPSQPNIGLPFKTAFPAENVRHHFVGQDQARGVYAKEVRLPAGYEIISHAHPYDHLSILASGAVEWKSGDICRVLTGPCAVTVTAGVNHSLFALTDTVWFCIHPTDETDPEAVDDVILSKGER
jgi:quercetin dioxygenase-like cupin family protein